MQRVLVDVEKPGLSFKARPSLWRWNDALVIVHRRGGSVTGTRSSQTQTGVFCPMGPGGGSAFLPL